MRRFVMVLMLGLVAVMADVLAAAQGMPLWAHGYIAPPPPAGALASAAAPADRDRRVRSLDSISTGLALAYDSRIAHLSA